jgi:hypothetical protein
MKNVPPLLLLFVLCSSCSYILPPKKVECCEQKAACCYDQMCCLPRYAKAAGVEPKAFTPETPSYASAEDLQPPPGAKVDKPGWLSRLNPYPWLTEEQEAAAAKKGQEKSQEAPSEPSEDEKQSFWSRLWPF